MKSLIINLTMIKLFIMLLTTGIIGPVSSNAPYDAPKYWKAPKLNEVEPDMPARWRPPNMTGMFDRPIPEPGMFPYIAVVWLYNLLPEWNGLIVNENTVMVIADSRLRNLTTADVDDLGVRVGCESWWDHENEIYEVEELKMIATDDDDEHRTIHFVALKVSRPFVWTQTVQPIQVAPPPENSCEPCTMITRGDTHLRPVDMFFKWDTVLIFDLQRCNNRYIMSLAEYELCFSTIFESVPVTKHDIGLPIVCNGNVVGLLHIEDDYHARRMGISRMVKMSYLFD